MPGDIAYDPDAMAPSVSLTEANGHLKNLLNGVAANTHFILGVKHTQTYSCIQLY
jgi:hypothetical protein